MVNIPANAPRRPDIILEIVRLREEEKRTWQEISDIIGSVLDKDRHIVHRKQWCYWARGYNWAIKNGNRTKKTG